MAPVVVTQANGDLPVLEGIFTGLSFFLLQRLPLRSDYINKIKANGGRVVSLEDRADHVIADHVRRDAPSGSTSYTFIDKCLQAGKLLDVTDSPAGAQQQNVRKVGSVVPAKSMRTTFTEADDLLLRQWVAQESALGGAVKGNEIYKRLEAHNSRHTYHSWRDRYLKKFLLDPPQTQTNGSTAVSASPVRSLAPELQESVVDASVENETLPARPVKRRKVEQQVGDASVPAVLSLDDFKLLFSAAEDIEDIEEGEKKNAWKAWAREHPHYTDSEWHNLYVTDVRPMYLSVVKRKNAATNGLESSGQQVSNNDGEQEDDVLACGEVSDALDDDTTKSQQNSASQAVNNMQNKSSLTTREDAQQRSQILHESRPSHPPESVDGPQGTIEKERTGIRHGTEDHTATSIIQHTSVYKAADDALLTSDANRAADLQVREELMHGHKVGVPEMSSNPRPMPKEDGHPLTAANLANQQAQQHEAAMRSTGLTADDTSRRSITPLIKEVETVIVEQRGVSSDSNSESLPSDPLQTWRQRKHRPSIEQLNVLADRASHEVVAADPASPTSSERPLQSSTTQNAAVATTAQESALSAPFTSQSEHFETQMQYPKLPARPARDFDLEEDHIPSSSQSMYSQLNLRIPVESTAGISRPEIQSRHQGRRLWSPEFTLDTRTKRNGSAILAQDAIDPPLLDTEFDHFIDPDNDLDLAIPEPDDISSSRSSQSRGQTLVGLTTPKKATRSQDALVVKSPMGNIDDASRFLEKRSKLSKGIQVFRRPRVSAFETQDVFNAETQDADFDIPPPPSDLDEPSEVDQFDSDSRSPLGHSSIDESWEGDESGMQHEHLALEDSQESVDTWISTMKVRGFDEFSVVEALKHASMRPELAVLILVEWRSGKGLPDDVPGIWSAREDGILAGANARDLRLLEEKHGWDEMMMRMDYLTEREKLLEA